MESSSGFKLFGWLIDPCDQTKQLLLPNPSDQPKHLLLTNPSSSPSTHAEPIPNPSSSPNSTANPTNHQTQQLLNNNPSFLDSSAGFMLFGSFIDPSDKPPTPPQSQTPPPPPTPTPTPTPTPVIKLRRVIIKHYGKRYIIGDKKTPQTEPEPEPLPQPPTDDLIPRNLRRVLRSMGVPEDHTPTHFFTKTLFKSDVKHDLARLTIPRHQLLRTFLTDQEEAILQQRVVDGDLKRLEVVVVDPSRVTRVLKLSRWNLNKNSEKTNRSRKRRRSTPSSSWSYSLNGGWKVLVDCNNLTAGDTLQLWSFRMPDATLGFIIFKDNTAPADHSVDNKVDNGTLRGRTLKRGRVM